MWDSVPEGLPARGWAELDENGWGALIGWAAGPENLRRGPRQDDSARTVAVTRTDRGGNVVKSVEAFTAEGPAHRRGGSQCLSGRGRCGAAPSGFPLVRQAPRTVPKLGRVFGRRYSICLCPGAPADQPAGDRTHHEAGHSAAVRRSEGCAPQPGLKSSAGSGGKGGMCSGPGDLKLRFAATCASVTRPSVCPAHCEMCGLLESRRPILPRFEGAAGQPPRFSQASVTGWIITKGSAGRGQIRRERRPRLRLG